MSSFISLFSRKQLLGNSEVSERTKIIMLLEKGN